MAESVNFIPFHTIKFLESIFTFQTIFYKHSCIDGTTSFVKFHNLRRKLC
jgi:hypothetical protein